MAESTNGGTTTQPPKPPEKKEMSMELRLLLAFILMGAVLFLTPRFFKTVAPPPPAKKASNITAPVPPVTNAGAPAVAAPATPGEPQAVPPVAAVQEQTFVVDTDDYHITFSNRGGVVQSWRLKKYKDHSGKDLELVNTAASVDRPWSFYFPGQKPSVDLNQALYAAKPDADGLGIAFEYSNGSVAARKSFRFRKDRYLSQVETQVTDSGKPVDALLEWRGGFGDFAVPNPVGSEQSVHFDAADNKLIGNAAKAAKNGPVTSTGVYSFAGIEDTYFAAVFLPADNTTIHSVTFADPVPTPFDKTPQPMVGSAVGDGPANRFSAYVGPKDLDILNRVNPKLTGLVDFGWFGFLAKPLFLIVNWVTDHFIHNYGWSIVVVTVALNFILFPLKLTSMKSMKKMQALQPQIQAINDKYKNVSIRDPRKADQNQEVMELYKKHGVNPMGGCVPMALQIPFFIAFYKVFMVSVEMRGAHWLWVTDLSQPELISPHPLPLIMIVTQFLMQKMTPSTTADPNQQKMMMILPLVFGFMFYNLSSGLVLYYLTSNLVGIAQQWFFNRTSLATAAERSVLPPRRKQGRK